jgi:hypothetical protein
VPYTNMRGHVIWASRTRHSHSTSDCIGSVAAMNPAPPGWMNRLIMGSARRADARHGSGAVPPFYLVGDPASTDSRTDGDDAVPLERRAVVGRNRDAQMLQRWRALPTSSKRWLPAMPRAKCCGHRLPHPGRLAGSRGTASSCRPEKEKAPQRGAFRDPLPGQGEGRIRRSSAAGARKRPAARRRSSPRARTSPSTG